MPPQIKQRIDQIRRGEVPEGYKKMKSDIIPEEWTLYLLSDIYTERKESGIPSLPILTVSIHSGVSDGALDDDELGKKVKRIEDKTQYRTAHSGDLVFNMMRAWQGAIGVVRSDGLVSPAYIVATPDKSAIYPPFMDYYMKTPQIVNRIHRKSYGVTDFRLRLYWDSFAMIGCAIPPLPEQKKIAEIPSAQDKLIALKEKLIEEKRRQKKYLMQQLLTQTCCNMTTLSKVSKITMGQSPDSSSYNDGGVGIPLLQGNADINKRLPNPRMYTSAPTKMCYKGDILLSVRAPVGTVARSNIEACIGRGICAINAGKLTDYIYQYLLFHEDKWGRISQGSTFESISGDDIAKVEIPLYNNYKEIQTILFAADCELDLLKRDLDQEKQKKKALMQLLLSGVVRMNV